MRNFKYIISVGFTLIILWASVVARDTQLTFDHFYDGQQVIDALNSLHNNYPKLTEIYSLGISEEGRDIWALTINNPKTGEDTEKPGIYVDGAIHGNEIQATEVCLYLAQYLLTNYDKIKDIKELVDSRSFYIIPVVNVDSRWRFFSEPSSYSIGRSGIVPYDDDRDGLFDEDGYEDLDGDGEILQMRVRDPFGNYKSHPDDPRIMIRTDFGEKGEWRILDREGIDNDGDGELNEDGPGYLDMNRNYGFRWQPRYVQSGSGDFPMSGMVTKAVADFIMTKPNIVFDYAFHNSGGMILRGPGSDLDGIYSPADIEVFDYLGLEGEKIIPGYRYLIAKEDLYTTHGDFDGFMYCNLGIFGFVGELFMSSQEQYRPPEKRRNNEETGIYKSSRPKTEERMKFNDFVNQGEMFKPWTKFTHPDLGEIEIGGWRSFTRRIPPPFMLQEMAHRNASLVIFTAKHTPDIQMELLDIKDLGDNLKRIRIRVTNKNAIPTLSKRALKHHIYRRDIIKIAGKGFTVISGGFVEDIHLDQYSPVEYRPEILFTGIPPFGKRDVQWIVKGSGKAVISFDSVKAVNRELKVKI